MKKWELLGDSLSHSQEVHSLATPSRTPVFPVGQSWEGSKA